LTNEGRDWLHEISRWRLDAAEEDNARYFYPVNGIATLTSGENSYVIGRKGSGKTAVAEHIRGLVDSNTFVQSLSFKNFPFNELYKLTDTGYSSPSQYTTIWKYIIYSAVCAMMAQNEAIDGAVSSVLKSHFDVDFGRALANTITKLTDRSGGFKIIGSGVDVSQKSIVIENDTPWDKRVTALEDCVVNYLDGSTYYILFDELDEDYKDVLEVSTSKQYFDLLIGLFKAVADVKRTLGSRVAVYPVVFLREDIYDLLRDNDKNKWMDSALTLNWSEGQLQQLVAFRLARSADESADSFNFQSVFQKLFTNDSTRAGGLRTKKHVFKYITLRTLLRPRDYISYIRECARYTLENGWSRLSPQSFSDVNKRYSRRFREEFVDEIQGAIPYINSVFDELSMQRKQIFRFTEFENNYNKAFSKSSGYVSFDVVCKVLFHYSAIGNQPSQHSARIFKYLQPQARINYKEKAIIHAGLLQSLQIS
jgi:energy-coupling factor transporter ATP-binding protein EcfA2